MNRNNSDGAPARKRRRGRKKALWKDIRRSIAHSRGRFFSIVALLALGSFALVGLWVAGPDMRATGEAYFGEYSLADLTVMSDYGLTGDDVAAIDSVDGARHVEYGYFKDVTICDTTLAVRVMSKPEQVSQVELVEGRLPSKRGELAIDSGLSDQYAIGDTIKIEEKANVLNDSTCLRDTGYKIVGYVNSPEIISIVNMGQSSAGTGSLKGYAVVCASEFDSDVYMTARLDYKDTESLDPYSNGYRDRVQAHKEELETALADRPAARLSEVKAAAQDAIDEGQAQVDDAKAQLSDARTQLDDAKETLASAAQQLADGASEIADAQAQVDDGAAQIDAAQRQIDAAQTRLDTAAATLESGSAALAVNRAALDDAANQLEDAQAQLAAGKQELDAAEKLLEQKQAELDSAKEQIAAYDTGRERVAAAKEQVSKYDEACKEVEAGRAEISQKSAELDASEKALDDAETELDGKENQVELMRAALPAAQQALDGANALCAQYAEHVADLQTRVDAETDSTKKWLLQKQLSAAQTLLAQAQKTQAQTQSRVDEMDAAIKKYDDGRAQVAEGREQIAEGRAQIEQKTSELDAAQAELDAKADEIAAARTEIAQREAELDALAPAVEEARGQVSAGEAELAAARAEFDAKKTEYEQGVAAYETSRAQYEQGLADWSAAAAKLASGKVSFDAGAAALASSRQTLASKMGDLANAHTQLASAKRTLAQKTAEYSEGMAEYQAGLDAFNEALPDAERQIADGESKLADARARLAKLALPAYEASTRREALGSEAYKTYDTVSEIVDSLARVFPVLLYLVAAFVTLSTMTRMVEEERINSGTLKALGYHDGDVALKFVVYGALAGGIGAFLGIVLGHTLLPWIVYSAYGHAFTLPPIHMGFYPGVTAVAIVLAALCSVVPAALAVRHELAERPAQLLLPKPPRAGSKILLERIGAVWKRLSFTHKVTARNLFRYKQRMLMTVLGVAGAVCMLVAGFGVQHSIQEMGARQFGQIIRYDMIVAQNATATDGQLGEIDELLDGDGVAAHVPLHYETLTRTAGKNGDTQEITLLVPQDGSSFDDYVELVDRKTDTPLSLGSSGAIISERLASLLGVSAGDTVAFKDADGTERSVTVTGVTEMYMGHFMFMSRDAYESCFGHAFESNAQLVRLHDGSLKSVEAASRNFMRLAGVKSVVQNTALEAQVNTVVKSLNMIMTVLIIVATLLAVVIMYNLTNLNVSERMRELSTIKVLGFHSNETTMYIYRETIILTILGVLAGYVLGVALHQYILNVVPPDTVMFNPELSAIEFWVPAVVIAVITAALYFVELRRLSTVDMLEALKSVE